MPKFKKIDKDFVLTDSSVNSYGFRLLTQGYQLADYAKNPIGYHMHDRNGVLLRWEDLRVEGDQVLGKPVINLSHPRGQQTVDEVENGFLNAASVGHIVAIEISEDPELMLKGQTGPTVTKWYNRECSLVDIPGNCNALQQLVDVNEKQINLADYISKTVLADLTMTKALLNAVHLAALGLSADADQATLDNKFNDLVAKAARAEKAEKELSDLKAATAKKDVTALTAAALASKKITKELADKLEKDYAENPTALKDLLDAMPAYTPITSQLGDDKKWGEDLAAKTWTELHESGKLEDLKAKNPELYKVKFKEQFGTEPKM